MNQTPNTTSCQDPHCSNVNTGSTNTSNFVNVSVSSNLDHERETSRSQPQDPVDMNKYTSISSQPIVQRSNIDPIEEKIQRDLQNLTSCYYEDNDTLSKKYSSYGGQLYNKDIMEQSHMDGRNNQYMNQTSAHVNPVDPVYNMQHQALVTPSNVGPEYNQQLNFSVKNEDLFTGAGHIGVEDRLGLKGNVGKSYMMSNSQTHTPQHCTSHIIPTSGEIPHITDVNVQNFTSPPQVVHQQSHDHKHDLKQNEDNVKANFDKVEDMY